MSEEDQLRLDQAMPFSTEAAQQRVRDALHNYLETSYNLADAALDAIIEAGAIIMTPGD